MDTLLGKTLNEITSICKDLGLPSFTAKQICQWLYNKRVTTIDEMTNLSKAAREKLNEKFIVGAVTFKHCYVSKDGTKKYLFPTLHEKFIETAYIPTEDRATLCVSTQVGCKMGCQFCMTAKQGFQGHLTSNEIINQIHSIEDFESLSNIVYMGMGEPFDNYDEVLKSLQVMTSDWGHAWSPSRITVSTVGIIPQMIRFLQETNCQLAVSLHSPFDEERKHLMPIQNVYPIKDVIQAIKDTPTNKQRRISFEYIVFDNINDTPKHVKELAKLLNGVAAHINLMRFHSIPDTPLQGASLEKIKEFQNALMEKGITTTIRSSRGEDIMAACGLLSTLKK